MRRMVLAIACLTLVGSHGGAGGNRHRRFRRGQGDDDVPPAQVALHGCPDSRRARGWRWSRAGTRFGPPASAAVSYWPAYAGRESSILLPNLDADPEREVLAELRRVGPTAAWRLGTMTSIRQPGGTGASIATGIPPVTAGRSISTATAGPRSSRATFASSTASAATPALRPRSESSPCAGGKLRVVTRSFRTSVRRDLRRGIEGVPSERAETVWRRGASSRP